MRRLIKILCVAATVAMTGCSALNFSVEGLLTAPKLTNEQSEIHQALVGAVGNNINLKYPKSGDNRSAYVIKNIDDEPGNEALVFYEYTGDSKKDGLMVNVLDKDEEDEWFSVKEFAGAGSEVSTVIISDISSDREPEVIVGYTSAASEEKTLEVYNFYGGEFKTIGTDNYSLLETFDINNDGTEELIVINKKPEEDSEEQSFNYTASLLEVTDGQLNKTQSVLMCNNVTSYVNTVTGRIDDKIHAVYIDELTNKNELQTEIIYCKNNNLQNPIETESEKLVPLCTRPAGYYSQDVDRDGVVEIPSVKPMTGYENVVEEEKVFLTSWYVYQDPNELVYKYSGYYSLSEGYIMLYPSRWDGQVTVKKDNKSEEMVFYKYDGDINGEMTELMRIAVASEDNKSDYLYSGYQLLIEKGRLGYMVKISAEVNEPLVPTIDEIKNCFYLAG